MRAFAVALNIALGIVVIAWLHSPPWDYRQAPRNQPNAIDGQKEAQAEKGRTKELAPVFPLNNAKQANDESKTTRGKRQDEAPEGWGAGEQIAAIASFIALLQFVVLVATWWIMLRTARRQLRAYLNFDEGNVVGFNTDSPIVQVKIKNFGQTPAYKVVSINMVHVTAFPLRSPLPALSPANAQNQGVLAPGGHFIIEWRLDNPRLPLERQAAVERGSAALYVYGEIRYEDAFGKPRWTTFRCIHGGDAVIHPAGNLATCEDGNDAD